ncbi:AI-2E family transporter [bacterium]|nr:AI-2E family transporter [bacterium]
MPAPTRKIETKRKTMPDPKPATEEIRFGRYFLLGVVILIGVVFFKMISMFLIPIILAAVFSGLFYGFYEKLLRRLRGRRAISAGLCCLLLLLLLLIPLYFLGSLVAQEALDFYDSAEGQVKEIIAQGDQGLLGRLSEIPLLQRLGLDRLDWQSSLQDVLKSAASLIANVINTATKSTFSVIANLFFTLFAMFYFFKDGDRLIAYIKKFSPLPNQYEDQLIRRFLAVSRGTIKGTMLIGFIKGVIGGLTFWIFGIRSPILWGVIMAILSLIPMVGAWLVMYPAAFVLMLTGQVWQGVLLFLIAAVLVGNIDNVLQPILVGRETGMHDLLIFFSTLGGIAMFGVMGFIIGPIIAAFFLTVLDFYAIEFRNQLVKGKKDDEQG